MQKKAILIIIVAAIVTLMQGCQSYTNFITYFNTYYNMDRIIKESEDEFEYHDEKTRIVPKVLVPQPEFYIPHSHTSGAPPFLQEFIITQQKRQPVRVKLDSVITKGSKVLAKWPNSKYTEGTLFLMAKTYFYKEEWIPAQIKLTEAIDNFPTGEYSPDAHLLLAKTLLIQRKFFSGETMLSRTVDVAWMLNRYDILSEAFRLEAELALYQNDIEKAQRPYRQAIAQTNNRRLKAQWQVELASLLYRAGAFEHSAREFEQARKYRPDYLALFESYLYQAASLNRLGKWDEARKILESLDRDRKFEEWRGYTNVELLQSDRHQSIATEDKKMLSDLLQKEKDVDKEYTNNPLLAAYYFERGLDDYNNNSWLDGRTYFSKGRVVRTPVSITSNKYYELLNLWDVKQREIKAVSVKYEDFFQADDSTKLFLASAYFEIGRVHEQLTLPDSAFVYYEKSAEITPADREESARYLYAYSRVLKPDNAWKADSLLEEIVVRYPYTEFGTDAMRQMGFTEAFVIDTAAELFTSGSNLMRFGDYPYAISQFWRVYTDFPEAVQAPRSLYSIGWIFERNIPNQDSALHYYTILLNEYPDSEYAQDIRLSIDYLMALQSGEPLPDSLQRRHQAPDQSVPLRGQPIDDPTIQAPMRTPPQPGKNMSPQEILRDPKSILQRGKELLGDPLESIREWKPPTTEEIWQNPFASPDSTSQTKEKPKPEDEE